MPLRSFPIFILFLLFTANLFAQDKASYGIFGDFSLNEHSANFQGLPGVPSCCPRYETGNGTGPAFGGIYQLPLTELFDLELRAAYRSLSGTLSATEATTVLHNGVPAQGSFQHTLTTGLSTVGIEPMVGMKIIGDLHLNLGLGAGILLSKTYAQHEEIVQPDGGGTFLDSNGNDTHSRIRNNLSGTIPNASALQLAALGGISYPLPLTASHTAFLVPEFLYSFGLTKIASDLTWNVNSLRFGLALMFSPAAPAIKERQEKIDTIRLIRKGVVAETIVRGKEERTEEPNERDGISYLTENIHRTDTLLVPKPTTTNATISAVGVTANGEELPVVRMTVEEFSSTIMTPMLHYIFFDENSSEIPGRYKRLSNVDTFTIRHIHSPEKLETYHHILNIVGRRLTDNPSSTITLTGCNEDIRKEKGNLELSRKRAESVRQYLTDAWHISGNRIKTEARNLSAKAANSETPDGSEENRRVEISSSDPNILFPVISDDTLRKANPPSLRFKPVVSSDEPVASWNVEAKQYENTLKIFRGNGDVPQVLDWKFESSSMPRFSGNINYELLVNQSGHASAVVTHSIPVEQITIRKKREERRGDTVINRFSLILFEVGSSEITASNAPVVKLIKDYIKPNSNVSVTGYTDRLGDAVYNQQLSENRAKKISSALGAKNISSKGVGQADLYDSSLPEGRLYTRTVDVVIETPVEK